MKPLVGLANNTEVRKERSQHRPYLGLDYEERKRLLYSWNYSDTYFCKTLQASTYFEMSFAVFQMEK